MTAMLASVSNLTEALQVLAAQVDIIDLKQPAAGALGALELDVIHQIVTAVKQRCPISATIGDLPTWPDIVAPAVKNMAATQVDFIKIGFFPNGDWPATVQSLSSISHSALIAVLFADCQPNFDILPTLKEAGFKGVMLDTANKTQGSLLDVMALSEISRFVSAAKQEQLFCGLAGSLKIKDISRLMPLQPNYLGFRGALCHLHNRTEALDSLAIKAVKKTLTDASRTITV
ncbi:MAG: (5-formylfuran-3-yl)methyl phosphate synthase [Methylococcaceae bacterium]|jgi:uncharacterized protein (UPF0264 family)